MPLPRFRLRTLMIAVAVVAMVLTLAVMREESVRLRRRAAYHAEAERSYRAALAASLRTLAEAQHPSRTGGRAALVRVSGTSFGIPRLEAPNQIPFFRACVARFGAAVAYHSAMRQKYDLAASRPWRPVEPDPPAPE